MRSGALGDALIGAGIRASERARVPRCEMRGAPAARSPNRKNFPDHERESKRETFLHAARSIRPGRHLLAGSTDAMTGSGFDAHELLQHSAWLHRLARSLAGDVGAADDLVQRTWMAALEHPPGPGVSLRRWLVTVVRNFARQDARAGDRRAMGCGSRELRQPVARDRGDRHSSRDLTASRPRPAAVHAVESPRSIRRSRYRAARESCRTESSCSRWACRARCRCPG